MPEGQKDDALVPVPHYDLAQLAIWLKTAASEEGDDVVKKTRTLINRTFQLASDFYGLEEDGKQPCPILGHEIPEIISVFAHYWDSHQLLDSDGNIRVPQP